MVDGVLVGAVYGLAAIGLTLIWGVMNVINLGHGALMTVGMFIAYGFFAAAGVNPYLALPLAALGGWLIGLAMYWIAVHRVIDAPHLASLLSTFAVNMILVGLGTWLLTGTPRNIDFNLGAMRLGPLVIQGARLAAAATAVLLAGALFLFLRRTTLGKAIRATADNRGAAELMGIATGRTLAISFGLGTMLACTAGALIATIFPFTIDSGAAYEPKSFVICVLGGLGNPLGALLAGLLLGAAEGLVPMFLPVGWTPVLEFGLFVLILVVRPTGLFRR